MSIVVTEKQYKSIKNLLRITGVNPDSGDIDKLKSIVAEDSDIHAEIEKFEGLAQANPKLGEYTKKLRQLFKLATVIPTSKNLIVNVSDDLLAAIIENLNYHRELFETVVRISQSLIDTANVRYEKKAAEIVAFTESIPESMKGMVQVLRPYGAALEPLHEGGEGGHHPSIDYLKEYFIQKSGIGPNLYSLDFIRIVSPALKINGKAYVTAIRIVESFEDWTEKLDEILPILSVNMKE